MAEIAIFGGWGISQIQDDFAVFIKEATVIGYLRFLALPHKASHLADPRGRSGSPFEIVHLELFVALFEIVAREMTEQAVGLYHP